MDSPAQIHCFSVGRSRRISAPSAMASAGLMDETTPAKDDAAYFRP